MKGLCYIKLYSNEWQEVCELSAGRVVIESKGGVFLYYSAAK